MKNATCQVPTVPGNCIDAKDPLLTIDFIDPRLWDDHGATLVSPPANSALCVNWSGNLHNGKWWIIDGQKVI
jgi:hypothetical protein